MTDREVTHKRVADVPTDLLANRFVGSLILAKGNLLKYEALAANLIRELRGEPHPDTDGEQTSKEDRS